MIRTLGVTLLLLTIATAGCATSSKTSTKELEAPYLIKGPLAGAVNPEIEGYVERLFSPLASRGFVLADAADANALRFEVGFNPNVFNTQVRVTLIRNSQELLQVESSNAGWGTGIARPTAIANLVEAATKALDKELRGIRVVALGKKEEGDSNAASAFFDEAESYCEKLMSDQTLDPIRRRLSLDRRPGLGQLVDNSKASENEKPILIEYSDRAEACNSRLVEGRTRFHAATPLLVIWEAERNAKLRNLVELYEGQTNWGQYLQRKLDIEQKRDADVAAIEQELAKQAAEERDRTAAARQRAFEARQRADQIAAQQATAYAAILQATRPLPTTPTVIQPASRTRFINCNRMGTFTSCNVF